MTSIYNFFLKLHTPKSYCFMTFLLLTNQISDQVNLRCRFKLKISVKSMLKVTPNSIDQSALGLWKRTIWFLGYAASNSNCRRFDFSEYNMLVAYLHFLRLKKPKPKPTKQQNTQLLKILSCDWISSRYIIYTTIFISGFLLKCCFSDSYRAVNPVIIMPVGLHWKQSLFLHTKSTQL